MPLDPYQQTVRALSDRLVEAQAPIRILDAVKWDESIRQAFLAAGGRELPQVDRSYYHTRPLAFLFALFVLGTALLGHAFWNMEGAARAANSTQFLKNLAIMGGLLLLGLTGPGRFSLDRR